MSPSVAFWKESGEATLKLPIRELASKKRNEKKREKLRESESKAGYCIVCKNKTCGRYKLKVRDTKNGIGVMACVCRDCYNRFLSSHANEGMFRISRFMGWAKRRDRIRE